MKFAKEMNLKFSTNSIPDMSKMKYVLLSKVKGLKNSLAPIILNDDPLPWEDKVKHLGNILESDHSIRADCLLKHRKFIGKVNSVL